MSLHIGIKQDDELMGGNPTLNLVPKPQAGVELTELEGEGVLYDYDRMVMVYVNDSARAIWDLCDGHRTVGEIVDILANAFQNAGDQVGPDVQDVVKQLAREGLLELGEA
jgi:hypothetical protein